MVYDFGGLGCELFGGLNLGQFRVLGFRGFRVQSKMFQGALDLLGLEFCLGRSGSSSFWKLGRARSVRDPCYIGISSKQNLRNIYI